MSVFWPLRRNPDPTAITRFGRVLHWLGTGVGLFLVACGLNMRENDYWVAPAVFAALFLVGGRTLRYIFAGE